MNAAQRAVPIILLPSSTAALGKPQRSCERSKTTEAAQNAPAATASSAPPRELSPESQQQRHQDDGVQRMQGLLRQACLRQQALVEHHEVVEQEERSQRARGEEEPNASVTGIEPPQHRCREQPSGTGHDP